MDKSSLSWNCQSHLMIKLVSQIFDYYVVSISVTPSSEGSEQVLSLNRYHFCLFLSHLLLVPAFFFHIFLHSVASPSVPSELTGILNARVAKAGVDFTSV